MLNALMFLNAIQIFEFENWIETARISIEILILKISIWITTHYKEVSLWQFFERLTRVPTINTIIAT